MSLSDALLAAQQQSIDYPGDPVYVLKVVKTWSVISESRYSERGLEDPIHAIFENGKRIA